MNIHAQTLKRKKKKTPRKDSKLAESGFKIKNSNVFSLNVSRTRSSRTTNNAKKRREEKRRRRRNRLLDGTIFVPIAAIARMEAPPSKPPRTRLEGLVR